VRTLLYVGALCSEGSVKFIVTTLGCPSCSGDSGRDIGGVSGYSISEEESDVGSSYFLTRSMMS
jgi:hypothetical protein